MTEMILKSLLVGALVAGSPFALAEAGKTKSSEPSATSSSSSNASTKVSHKEAKKKCLDENPNMKGKELKDCIKNKMKG